jgi:ubiquinone biosynthesis protein COQ4
MDANTPARGGPEPANDAAASAQPPPRTRALNETETRYMQGDVEPVTSSVLTSNSKYLNNPYYRDAFMQASLRRHGHDLPQTYLIPMMARALAEVTDTAEYQRLLDAEKLINPEFGAWLARRPSNVYRPDQLAGYAAGALGAEIRAFLLESGMDMEFMYRDEPADDVQFMAKRQMGIHDICHIVTGFGPNNAGETGLQYTHLGVITRYFTPALAQYVNASNIWTSASSLKRTSLHYPVVMPALLEAMRQGITAGQGLKKPLMMVDWDVYLDWTLDDIAADLGFVRGPGAAWDWTTEAAMG